MILHRIDSFRLKVITDEEKLKYEKIAKEINRFYTWGKDRKKWLENKK